VGATAALVILPIISLLTPPTDAAKIKKIWDLRGVSEEEKEAKGVYHIIPVSTGGRMCLVIFIISLITFLIGILMGSKGLTSASLVAVIGMVICFLAGSLRLNFD